MFTLTADILHKIAPSIKGERAELIANYLTKICPLYGIDSADIFHEFLANVLVESGEFSTLSENLNYSAKRLMAVWPKRFPTLDIAQQYEHNPMKLANKVYGGRLGNNYDNDGYTFRGAGVIQITGRDNTTNFTNYYNQKFVASYSPEQIADLLRTDLSVSIHSACWIFAISFKLIDEAVNDEMKEIVKRINGGYTGLAERQQYYTQAKKYIV